MQMQSYSKTVRIVRELLNATFTEVDTWFDRHGDLLDFRPEGGGWRVAEILEHVTLTNHFLMLVIRKGCAKALKRAARGEPIPVGESDLELRNPIGRRGFPSGSPRPHGADGSRGGRASVNELVRLN